MKFFLSLLLITLLLIPEVKSQVPDDTNGRLYRLCKTWGYFKYNSQNKCNLKWDTLLNTTIQEVLASSSNADFNTALMNMFNKVGNNTYVANPAAMPDTNINVNTNWMNDPVFSQQVRDFLDTFTTYIYPDTSTCFVKFNDYSTSYTGYVDFNNDPVSMPIDFAYEENSLTLMFYYWNVINYFFPYRNLMDQDWDSTLYEFIPLIRSSATISNFHRNFLKLATKINDTHGSTSSSTLYTGFWGGGYVPEIYFTRVDSQCVVTKVKNIANISIGDILIAVNGIPIKDIEDSLSMFIPASNPAALYRDIYYNMMRGSISSSIGFNLLDSNNNLYTQSATRTLTGSAWTTWKRDKGLSTSYYIDSCGAGYVDMGKLQTSEVSAMYTALQNTPAIVFDVRNYPNGTVGYIAPKIFSKPIKSAIIHDPALTWLWSAPNYSYMPGWYYVLSDSTYNGSWSNTTPYNGKVYILTNQESQSHSEFTIQYLSHHPNAKVFGSQSAGADGNISYLTLPGGGGGDIYTYFTSLGWYYSDGYQQQRNGVRIDSAVSPTIQGIRYGKDEVLDIALEDMRSSSQFVSACKEYMSPSGKYTWTSSNTYKDTIPGVFACDSIMTIVLTVNNPDTSVVKSGDTLRASASAAAYQWIDCNNGDIAIPNETNQVFVASVDGLYAVIVTENSCIDTSSCYNLTNVGLSEINVTENIRIYPNPANQVLNIEFGTKINQGNLSIEDYTGRIIANVPVHESNRISVDTSTLAKGIYIARILINGEPSMNYKIVKE